MSYLLVGNYGVGNAGDEILRSYFLDRFPECQFLVLSASPREGELSRFPAGIRSFLSCRWLRTMRALWQSHGLVFGGGSLLTDVESPHACFVWWIHALFAWALRKPYYLAFQGIGPFRTRLGEALARFVVQRATFISVRDTQSLFRLMGNGSLSSGEGASTESFDSPSPSCHSERFDSAQHKLRRRTRGWARSSLRLGYGRQAGQAQVEVWKKSTEIVQSFDPSISFIEAYKPNNRSNNVFIFIPKYSTGWSSEREKAVGAALQDLGAISDGVRLLSLQPDDPREQRLCQALSEQVGVPVIHASSMSDVVHATIGARCVISQRYHGLIASLLCTVPFLAIPEEAGDKLDALASMCGCPSLSLSGLSSKAIATTDWEGLRGRTASLCHQYRRLVLQGEKALREALAYNAPDGNS
jgi:polysaccharide pyruvyl transferase WcaK-like protein